MLHTAGGAKHWNCQQNRVLKKGRANRNSTLKIMTKLACFFGLLLGQQKRPKRPSLKHNPVKAKAECIKPKISSEQGLSSLQGLRTPTARPSSLPRLRCLAALQKQRLVMIGAFHIQTPTAPQTCQHRPVQLRNLLQLPLLSLRMRTRRMPLLKRWASGQLSRSPPSCSPSKTPRRVPAGQWSPAARGRRFRRPRTSGQPSNLFSCFAYSKPLRARHYLTLLFLTLFLWFFAVVPFAPWVCCFGSDAPSIAGGCVCVETLFRREAQRRQGGRPHALIDGPTNRVKAMR